MSPVEFPIGFFIELLTGDRHANRLDKMDLGGLAGIDLDLNLCERNLCERNLCERNLCENPASQRRV